MTALDATFFYGTDLCHSSTLDTWQRLLAHRAPNRVRRARVSRDGRRNDPIDMTVTNALRDTACRAALTRGSRYEWLVATMGRGPFERAMGIAEIRGSEPSVIVVARVDAFVISPLGDGMGWGNTVTVQVRRRSVEGVPATDWVQGLFEEGCLTTEPVYARACTSEEWNSKNMDMSEGMEAIGVDLSASLPGVLIGLAPRPEDWSSPSYRSGETSVRIALGANLFFDRTRPDRALHAPDLRELGVGLVHAEGRTAVIARSDPAGE